MYRGMQALAITGRSNMLTIEDAEEEEEEINRKEQLAIGS